MHASAKRKDAGDEARDNYFTVHFDDLAFEPSDEARRDVGAEVTEWSGETFETAVQDGRLIAAI